MPGHIHVTVQEPDKPRLDCGGNKTRRRSLETEKEGKKKGKNTAPGKAMPDLNSLPPSTRSPPPPSPRPISAPRSLSPAPLSTSSSSASPRLPVLGGMSSTNNDVGDPATSPTRPSASPSRAASTSLQAAAAVNAGLQHQGSRRALAISPFILPTGYSVST